MIGLHPAHLLAPLLLATLGTSAVLHRPSSSLGAPSAEGSQVYYAAQVYSATPLPGPRSGTTHPVPQPATTSLPRLTAPPVRAPQAPVPLSSFDVRGKPTISAALIDQVLSAYGSPMAGEGRDIYNLGVKYEIDPAFCLAFFVHESAAGTRGEAVITHNLGNIRATAGSPSRDGYRYYDSWLDGAEDWYRLISHVYVGSWGLSTVDQIVPVYAPSADSNDPAAYIDDVEQLVTAWRAQS
jgi:hypothetical protein